MPKGLQRWYERYHLHFITFSCYRRLPLLASARRRGALLRHIEAARRALKFPLLGYVVMPEHVHLLIAPPENGDPSLVIKSIKQRTARAFRPKRKAQPELFETAVQHLWQKRFYDFNVYTDEKRVEKLRYMHRNPVKRGLVQRPEDWLWSSYRSYMLDEAGPVKLTRFEELPLREFRSRRSPT